MRNIRNWFGSSRIMRQLIVIVGFLAAGCGGNQTEEISRQAPSGSKATLKETAVVAETNGKVDPSERTLSPEEQKKIIQAYPLRAGNDWPRFLGPFGTSVSAEKGMISPWPAKGLKLVWQKPMGTGYGMPAISQGRLFQFDRDGDRARLRCFDSITGQSFWRF